MADLERSRHTIILFHLHYLVRIQVTQDSYEAFWDVCFTQFFKSLPMVHTIKCLRSI